MTRLTRRNAVGALAGAGVGTSLISARSVPASAAGSAMGSDVSSWSTQDKVLALAKQQGRLDAGRVIWRTRGIIYGFQAPASPVPLVRFKGCEQQWWEPEADGTFSRYTSLLTYFTDAETDQIIQSYTNPLTGEKVDLKENWSRVPEGQTISDRGVTINVIETAFPDFYTQSSIDDTEMSVIDDVVSFKAKMHWPEPLVRSPYNQDNTFYASLADLTDPSKTWIPSHGAGHILMPSMPNVGMPDPALGQVIWHVEFYKVKSLDSLPEDYLAQAMSDYGDEFEVNPKNDTEPSKLTQNLQRLGYLGESAD